MLLVNDHGWVAHTSGIAVRPDRYAPTRSGRSPVPHLGLCLAGARRRRLAGAAGRRRDPDLDGARPPPAARRRGESAERPWRSSLTARHAPGGPRLLRRRRRRGGADRGGPQPGGVRRRGARRRGARRGLTAAPDARRRGGGPSPTRIAAGGADLAVSGLTRRPEPAARPALSPSWAPRSGQPVVTLLPRGGDRAGPVAVTHVHAAFCWPAVGWKNREHSAHLRADRAKAQLGGRGASRIAHPPIEVLVDPGRRPARPLGHRPVAAERLDGGPAPPAPPTPAPRGACVEAGAGATRRSGTDGCREAAAPGRGRGCPGR